MIQINLSGRELLDLVTELAENQYSESDYLAVKDRHLRKIFKANYMRGNKLWLKLQHTLDKCEVTK
jgi:hypothetical protein